MPHFGDYVNFGEKETKRSLNEIKEDQKATTHINHLVFLFFCVNGGIKWNQALYGWILHFKSFQHYQERQIWSQVEKVLTSRIWV